MEFHRGWQIEVTPSAEGFQNICRSSFGDELTDGKLYLQKIQAWQAAIKLIDQFHACYALKQLLRGAYEEEKLGFKEWQQLSQSLDSQLP